MEGTPGLIPKAALTTSRIVYKPFLIPQKLNDSATLVGSLGNGTVGAINAAVGTSIMKLQPRVGAKFLANLFTKVDSAVKRSDQIATRNKQVFWDPFSQASEGMGRAIAGPGAYYYAKKAGFPDPSNPDVIKGLLNLKLFQYPVPAPAEAPAGPPAQAAPPEGAAAASAEPSTQAAEGAAQAQPAA